MSNSVRLFLHAGQCVFVAAGTDGGTVQIHDASGICRQEKFQPDDRLLVAADAGIALGLSQGAQHFRFHAADFIRLQAFIDHGRACSVRPARRSQSVVVLRISSCVEDPKIARLWFIGALARQDTAIEALSEHFRRTESYQLIRFLLGQTGFASVDELGKRYGLSPSHFHRKCKQALGRSLKSELRVLRAARSLLDYAGRQRSFTRLAQDHGFASLSHFCSDIKELLGMAPGEIYSPAMLRSA